MVTIRQMGALVTDDFHKVSGIVGSTVPSNNTRFVNFGRVNPAPSLNGRKKPASDQLSNRHSNDRELSEIVVR